MTAGPTHAELRALAAACVAVAKENGRTFALVESCTGGLVANLITDVPGASQVFLGGWLPYADRRKIEDLGVEKSLLARHGAVSEAVAKALAGGARERAGADVAVATTGIAGPSGGTKEKPVGLVWIGAATARDVNAVRFQSEAAERVSNKRAFAARALQILHDLLQDTGAGTG